MDAFVINGGLERLYSATLPQWKSLRIAYEKEERLLSIPSFLKVSSSYVLAKPKVVFVGQETHGWFTTYAENPNNLSAAAIMDFYELEWTELFQKYQSSPYWRAMRSVAGALDLTNPPRSFLFSNIFPCDLDKKRGSEVLLETLRAWRVLPEELSLLAPDYVIFFCGPAYCYNLTAYFGEGPTRPPSSSEPVVRYRPQNSLWKGFVTYHPNYLQRSNRWDQLGEIARFIKEEMTFQN